jgi:hypothetical protein
MKAPNNKALINRDHLLNADRAGFGMAALELFRYQYRYNNIYRQFCDALHVREDDVDDITRIPFLPISFFKTHTVLTSPAAMAADLLTFESSGTTDEATSRHYVWDNGVYETSLLSGFQQFYGDPANYAILALLPSYLERKNASLVYMAKTLMAAGRHPANGFYIDEWQALADTLQQLELSGQKTLLLGVTFALLDFAHAYPMALRNTIVMETGGMKGHKKELTRAEVHNKLHEKLGVQAVHSEYGMTEVLSQAYAAEHGIFMPTATMQVLVRDVNDPLDVSTHGSGVLNIVDLANMYSCAFIATDDIGIIAADGSFEVLGRLDHSALRGCSLMAV